MDTLILKLVNWLIQTDVFMFMKQGVLVAAGWSPYLLVVTHPLFTPPEKDRNPSIGYRAAGLKKMVHNDSYKNRRRGIMKPFQLFIIALSVFVVTLMTNSCYTTFGTVRDAGLSSVAVYTEDSGYDDDYEAEAPESQVTLQYRPSRLVVKKTYYDYGRHVRTVRYSFYDSWEDPDYYAPVAGVYDDGPDFYFNISFGIDYFPYRWWRHSVYFPAFPIVWQPPLWYDPWWCDLVYYPVYYPFYYPLPVYYPPVYYYDPPYFGSVPSPKKYQRRDWDRRKPVSGRRIVRGGGRVEKARDGNRDDTRRRRIVRRDDNNLRRKSDISRVRSKPVNDRRRIVRGKRNTMRRDSERATKIIRRERDIRMATERNTRTSETRIRNSRYTRSDSRSDRITERRSRQDNGNSRTTRFDRSRKDDLRSGRSQRSASRTYRAEMQSSGKSRSDYLAENRNRQKAIHQSSRSSRRAEKLSRSGSFSKNRSERKKVKSSSGYKSRSSSSKSGRTKSYSPSRSKKSSSYHQSRSSRSSNRSAVRSSAPKSQSTKSRSSKRNRR